LELALQLPFAVTTGDNFTIKLLKNSFTNFTLKLNASFLSKILGGVVYLYQRGKSPSFLAHFNWGFTQAPLDGLQTQRHPLHSSQSTSHNKKTMWKNKQ